MQMAHSVSLAQVCSVTSCESLSFLMFALLNIFPRLLMYSTGQTCPRGVATAIALISRSVDFLHIYISLFFLLFSWRLLMHGTAMLRRTMLHSSSRGASTQSSSIVQVRTKLPPAFDILKSHLDSTLEPLLDESATLYELGQIFGAQRTPKSLDSCKAVECKQQDYIVLKRRFLHGCRSPASLCFVRKL
jgi:hypothetical protein